MADGRQDMELLKKELADVSAFVKERVEPVHDERVRLRKAIEALTKEQQEYRRSGLLNGSGDDGVVKSGPYAGCDQLDLAIMGSVKRAAESQMGVESVQGLGCPVKGCDGQHDWWQGR